MFEPNFVYDELNEHSYNTSIFVAAYMMTLRIIYNPMWTSYTDETTAGLKDSMICIFRPKMSNPGKDNFRQKN